MPPLPRLDILIALAVAAAIGAGFLVGLPRTLGAHPWWAGQTWIVGGLGGAVLWLAMRRAGLPFRVQAILAALALAASAAAAHFGKQAFAASFAENALAGRFWYFGWFALSGSIALALAIVTARILHR